MALSSVGEMYARFVTATLPKFIVVALVKPVPVMVTSEPPRGVPELGVIALMTGVP